MHPFANPACALIVAEERQGMVGIVAGFCASGEGEGVRGARSDPSRGAAPNRTLAAELSRTGLYSG